MVLGECSARMVPEVAHPSPDPDPDPDGLRAPAPQLPPPARAASPGAGLPPADSTGPGRRLLTGLPVGRTENRCMTCPH